MHKGNANGWCHTQTANKFKISYDIKTVVMVRHELKNIFINKLETEDEPDYKITANFEK